MCVCLCHTSLFTMIRKNDHIGYDFAKIVRSFHETPFVSSRDYVTLFKQISFVGMRRTGMMSLIADITCDVGKPHLRCSDFVSLHFNRSRSYHCEFVISL